MQRWKWIVLAVCLFFTTASVVEAQRYSGGSRSSSGSRSSGSSGSRYSGGSGSRPSSSSRPPSSTRSSGSSKYSGGSGSSSKPSGSSFGSSRSKYSGGSGSSSKPSGSLFGGSSDTDTSSKPTKRQSGGLSEKARSSQMERSRRQYVETTKATAPPRPTYTTQDGKTVNVKPSPKIAETIRSKPSTYYQPDSIRQRTEVHVTQHYQHPYDWYYSQPPVYMGGGYNTVFWYMMLEWDAERRARWLYHNRDNIEQDAYERGMKDAQVAQAIAKLEADKVARDPNYVDPEFADDPSVIMDAGYVEAVYNPEVEESHFGFWFFVICIGFVSTVGLIWLLCWLIFKVRWGGQ